MAQVSNFAFSRVGQARESGEFELLLTNSDVVCTCEVHRNAEAGSGHTRRAHLPILNANRQNRTNLNCQPATMGRGRRA
eukprot:2630734-Rhodomonas_salina.1